MTTTVTPARRRTPASTHPTGAQLALALYAASFIIAAPRGSTAFAPQTTTTTSAPRLARSSRLGATASKKRLSDRQLQFWEDVDDGLLNVEKAFGGPGCIERVQTFGSRARGDLPLPEPLAPGHQPSEEHVDGLTAEAFWEAVDDSQKFPWAAALEENADVIAREFQRNLLRSAEHSHSSSQLFSGDSACQSGVMGTGWSAFRLQRLGVWNIENCNLFPETYNLLRSLKIPLAVRGVCFARQSPGSGVAPHTDGRNFILTHHLGLKIPDGCWIHVGNERRAWAEGKLTTLDTSFEHSTGNPTADDRHVLIIDFWHPELTDAERAGLEVVYDLRNQFENGLVPFRKPRRVSEEKEGQGLGGLWKILTGTGN